MAAIVLVGIAALSVGCGSGDVEEAGSRCDAAKDALGRLRDEVVANDTAGTAIPEVTVGTGMFAEEIAEATRASALAAAKARQAGEDRRLLSEAFTLVVGNPTCFDPGEVAKAQVTLEALKAR